MGEESIASCGFGPAENNWKMEGERGSWTSKKARFGAPKVPF